MFFFLSQEKHLQEQLLVDTMYFCGSELARYQRCARGNRLPIVTPAIANVYMKLNSLTEAQREEQSCELNPVCVFLHQTVSKGVTAFQTRISNAHGC